VPFLAASPVRTNHGRLAPPWSRSTEFRHVLSRRCRQPACERPRPRSATLRAAPSPSAYLTMPRSHFSVPWPPCAAACPSSPRRSSRPRTATSWATSPDTLPSPACPSKLHILQNSCEDCGDGFLDTTGCATSSARWATPDEMYLDRGDYTPGELAACHARARAARLGSNRQLSCGACRPPVQEPPSLPDPSAISRVLQMREKMSGMS
jgi:hypothetical protein